MANHHIQPPDHAIWPDHPIARRQKRHILVLPTNDEYEYFSGLFTLLERLEGDDVHQAFLENGTTSFIIRWERLPQTIGASDGKTPSTTA